MALPWDFMESVESIYTTLGKRQRYFLGAFVQCGFLTGIRYTRLLNEPLWSRKVGKLQYLILFGNVDRCLNGPWRIKIHCSHIMAIIYLIIYYTFPHFFPPQRCLLSKDIDKDKSQIHDLIGGEGSFRLLQKYPTGIHPPRNKGLIKL